MRKIFIAFLILSQVLFAQEEKRKIEDLIDEILEKIENFYSTDEILQNHELSLRQKELQKQLEKIKAQLELLKKQKEFMDEEKLKEEIEKIQRTAIEIQKTSQELIEQAKRRNEIYSSFLSPLFRFKGETEIDVNDYIEGNVLVQDGNLIIKGKIKGNILVENGDVILKDGSEVIGDIFTTNGEIKISEKAKFEGKTYENFSMLAEIDRITSYDRKKHRQELKYRRFYEEYPGIDNLYLEFERVSGFKLGLIYPRKISNILNKPIAIYGYGAYTTKSHRWIFSVGIDRKILSMNENFYILTGVNLYSTIGTKDNWLISPNANTISALLWNNDYRDYFKIEGFTFNVEFILSSNSNLKLFYSNDSYLSEMTRYIKYASWNKKRPFRENPEVYEGNLKSLAANLKYDNFQLIEGFKRSGIAFEIGFEKELGNMRYSILTAELKARISLSGYDNFGLRLKIGTSDKILPKQKSFEIGGFGTLYAFPFKSFEGNKMLLANFEYIIENATDIFDFVNLFIFFDAGYTNNQEGKITSGFKIDNLNKIKSDFGFGLGTESMKTRIYLAWRTDKKTPPMIVVRLSKPF